MGIWGISFLNLNWLLGDPELPVGRAILPVKNFIDNNRNFIRTDFVAGVFKNRKGEESVLPIQPKTCPGYQVK